MTSPLNPALYQRLIRIYGDVEVARPGVAIDWFTEWQQMPGQEDRRLVRRVRDHGEAYVVRCALCHDHRPRLYITHRWGEPDPAVSRSRNLWLLCCFNEDCYRGDYDRQKDLFDSVWTTNGGVRATRSKIIQGRRSLYSRDELGEIPNPGPCVRLDVLAKDHPNHEALRYVAGRGFDPLFLGRIWAVSYCMTSRYRWATNRIIIPIRQQGMQVGWQARYIGDDVHGESFNDAGVPKYWTSPSMPRRLVAYNIERALLHPTLVIVEGTTDVGNVGPMATGLLGTTASDHVLKMIAAGMKRHGDDAVVIVALDPQPKRRQNPRPAPHPIDVLVGKLRALLPGKVVPVWLPEEYDPGNIDRRWMIELIKEKVSKVGLVATFARPMPLAAQPETSSP